MMIMKSVIRFAAVVCLVTGTATAQEWMAEARLAINRRDLPTALTIINQQLAKAPNDWDAVGWHARVISWQGNWQQAETEYRQVLEHAPKDTDILLGLADVLIWQQKDAAALQVLVQAKSANAPPADVLKRQARAFTVLGQADDAKNAYRELLVVDPANAEARAALSAGTRAAKFDLRLGSNTDVFNYTDAANAQAIALRARWNPHWSTWFGGDFFQRFGQNAYKFSSGVAYNFSKHDWVSVGGAAANKQDVISRFDQMLEYGHSFQVHAGPVRGLETSIEERALWFTTSQVTLVRGNVIVYLPGDWIWNVSLTGARSAFDLAGSSWTPSGSTRLSFPLHERWRGNALFAVGSENYSNVDQIGQFSAHTYGGGLQFKITEHQDISAFGAYQLRSKGRTQTTVGVSYGIRF
jgi:YaiO family outer membrane protein